MILNGMNKDQMIENSVVRMNQQIKNATGL